MTTKVFGRNTGNVGSSDTTFISQFDDQVRDGNTTATVAIGGPEVRFLVRFDFGSEIPAGSTINSVTLTLYCAEQFGSDPQTFMRMERSWSPTTARWSEASTGVAWGTAGANAASDATALFVQNNDGITGLDGFSDSSLTALVQSWTNGSVPNYGTRHSASAYSLWGMNGAGDGARPYLTVDYTEPVVITGVPVAWFVA